MRLLIKCWCCCGVCSKCAELIKLFEALVAGVYSGVAPTISSSVVPIVAHPHVSAVRCQDSLHTYSSGCCLWSLHTAALKTIPTGREAEHRTSHCPDTNSRERMLDRWLVLRLYWLRTLPVIAFSKGRQLSRHGGCSRGDARISFLVLFLLLLSLRSFQLQRFLRDNTARVSFNVLWCEKMRRVYPNPDFFFTFTFTFYFLTL